MWSIFSVRGEFFFGKIAVEIQDWSVETMEEKRIDSMVQFEETKLNSRIDGLELEMRTGFASSFLRFQLSEARSVV